MAKAIKFAELGFAAQQAAALETLTLCGLDAGRAADFTKYLADAKSHRGDALKRAKVAESTWKVASTIPTKVRADYPLLIAAAAFEELHLARERAENALRAIRAAGYLGGIPDADGPDNRTPIAPVEAGVPQ